MSDIPTWTLIKIPPCICRILAKTKGSDGRERAMSDYELMKKTGWGRQYLRSIYQRASWKDVTHAETDRFLWACGLHPSKQRRYTWLLKRAWKNGMDGIRNMRHLKREKRDKCWRSFLVNALLRMVERVLENEQRNA